MSDKVKNYITVQLIGGSEYVEDIAITDQEAMLLDVSGNMPFQNIVGILFVSVYGGGKELKFKVILTLSLKQSMALQRHYIKE